MTTIVVLCLHDEVNSKGKKTHVLIHDRFICLFDVNLEKIHSNVASNFHIIVSLVIL